jgi:hypothetical protein
MAPKPSNAERKGITVTRLLIVAATMAAASTAVFAWLFGADLYAHQHTPDRATLAGLIVSATAWIGFFCAAVNDASERRSKRSEARRDQLIWGIADRLDKIDADLKAFRRQSENALVVLHDEVNVLAGSHTGEIRALAETIEQWGDEQETKGELAGLRLAVGIAPVPDKPLNGRSNHLRSLS